MQSSLHVEDQVPDKLHPADVVIEGFHLLGQSWVVHKPALKQPPATVVEDVPPGGEEPLEWMPHLQEVLGQPGGAGAGLQAVSQEGGGDFVVEEELLPGEGASLEDVADAELSAVEAEEGVGAAVDR